MGRYSIWIKILWFFSPLILILVSLIVMIMNRNELENYRISTSKEWVQRMRHERDANERQKEKARVLREEREAYARAEVNGKGGTGEIKVKNVPNGKDAAKGKGKLDKKSQQVSCRKY